ncbi:hypothetical protein [Glaciimonas sp. PAMC28666]|uniref:hypothetical protein n=1 Tax=Glaciimonas sp. PAMC28666 TaxID=2807626 RepID=UPI001966B297|nr:hypothetical protein [Glaciimonas sp. PAMC28666]QRX82487.1 hypothetical protein JQN73_20840 [Glaciimonas sp. PAMC28666]
MEESNRQQVKNSAFYISFNSVQEKNGPQANGHAYVWTFQTVNRKTFGINYAENDELRCWFSVALPLKRMGIVPSIFGALQSNS